MLTLGGPGACSQFEEALLPFPVKIPQHNRHWRMVSFWKIPLTGRIFTDPGPQWHFKACVPRALQDGLALLVPLWLQKDVFTVLRGKNSVLTVVMLHHLIKRPWGQPYFISIFCGQRVWLPGRRGSVWLSEGNQEWAVASCCLPAPSPPPPHPGRECFAESPLSILAWFLHLWVCYFVQCVWPPATWCVPAP